MMPTLNDLVGLPSNSPITEIAHAADRCSEGLLKRSMEGEAVAQRELITLKCAYLVWAYAHRLDQCATGY
jgi:hypothetical protein